MFRFTHMADTLTMIEVGTSVWWTDTDVYVRTSSYCTSWSRKSCEYACPEMIRSVHAVRSPPIQFPPAHKLQSIRYKSGLFISYDSGTNTV